MASYSDMAVLAGAALFQSRVAAALWQTCTFIASEAISTVAHWQRKEYVSRILNEPEAYKQRFVDVVSVDSSVIGDATQNGSVTLTAGNVDSQQVLVTDTHIANAISATFNAFIAGI